jgi:transcriptional regulator with XRE-family HTH domain
MATEPQGMTFQQAAQEFRAHLGRSQQSMATFLGVSMAALRTYESGAVAAPDARAATAYMLAAETCDRPDLVEVFGSALRQALGLNDRSLSAADYLANRVEESRLQTLFFEAVNPFEERMITALLACIRGQGPFKKYQESILQALARPWLHVDRFSKSLRFLPRDSAEDQLTAFENAMKSQPPAGQGDPA